MSVQRVFGATDDQPIICWRNLVPEATSLTGGAGIDPSTPGALAATYPTWEAIRITGATGFFSITFAGDVQFDYVAISGARRQGSGSVSIFNSGSVLLASGTGVDGTAIFLHPPEVTSQVFITFGGMASLGNIMLGMRTTIPRRLYVGHSPITLSRQTEVIGGRSMNGQFLGRAVRSEGVGTQVSLSNIEPDFYRDEIDPMVAAARSQPFYWAWRPQSYPTDAAYCWMEGDVAPTNQRPNGLMGVDLQFSGRTT